MKQLNLRQYILIIFLVILTFLVYFPSIVSDFAGLDDSLLVSEDLEIHELTFDNIKNKLTKPTAGLYHPVVTLSYDVEVSLFGRNPEIIHFDNIVLHILNTLLVFIIFFLLTKSFKVSYVIMFLFALHPVHVEVVSWISARKDSMYALFYLAAIYFYIKTYFSNKTKTLITLSLVCFLLSCCSKAMAITLPFTLLLIDYWYGKFSLKNIYKYIPYLILSIVFVIIGMTAHYEGYDTFEFYKMFVRLLNVSYHILFYLGKFILPINLYCTYPYFYPMNDFPPWYITFSFVPVLTGIYFLIRSLKYTKEIFFSFAFFLVVLLPSSGLLPSGIIKVADRYVYLAYIGLFYLVAIALKYIYCKVNKKIKNVIVVICLILSCTLIYLTYNRVLDWKYDNQEPPKSQVVYESGQEDYL